MVADDGTTTPGTAVLEGELRALTRRMDGLNSYVERLAAHAVLLRDEADEAARHASEAAAALDNVTSSPAPWLAIRGDLTRRVGDARLAAQAASAGVAAWARVEKADDEHERKLADARRIANQRSEVKSQATRNTVIGALSRKFGEILRDFDYPKLGNPHIDSNLIPHVRNLPYTQASSVGMVLISLAWNLALWEIAHEQDASAPGVLVIDSPQKNLGYRSEDEEFADATLVDNFYAHAKDWLSSDGVGAQLIVIDNTPPELAAADVVIRFSRRADDPPYGLITDATS